MPTVAERRLPAAIELLDGLQAFEQVVRLRPLYLSASHSGAGDPTAEQRGRMLDLGRRLSGLIDPADLFIQTCREQIQQVADEPELEARLKEVLASAPLAGHVSGDDPVATAVEAFGDARSLLAEERGQIPSDLDQLRGGKSPVREQAPPSLGEDLQKVGEGLVAVGVAIVVLTEVASGSGEGLEQAAGDLISAGISLATSLIGLFT